MKYFTHLSKQINWVQTDVRGANCTATGRRILPPMHNSVCVCDSFIAYCFQQGKAFKVSCLFSCQRAPPHPFSPFPPLLLRLLRFSLISLNFSFCSRQSPPFALFYLPYLLHLSLTRLAYACSDTVSLCPPPLIIHPSLDFLSLTSSGLQFCFVINQRGHILWLVSSGSGSPLCCDVEKPDRISCGHSSIPRSPACAKW